MKATSKAQRIFLSLTSNHPRTQGNKLMKVHLLMFNLHLSNVN